MVRWGRYLEIMEQERLIDNAATVGEHLLGALRGLESELGGVLSNARGRGLMIAFDLPTPELRGKALGRIFENRMLLLGCGPRSIRFRPPLNLSRAEADAGIEIIRKSLKSL
jgi:L-lysine 6-transaminase